jgi:hypothetical protein
MTTLETRVRHALANNSAPGRSPWSGLMALFQSDREAFYLLACDGVSADADSGVRQLAELAQQVRSIVRGTYQIVPGENGKPASIQSRSGIALSIPAGMLREVELFLQEIDGKSVGTVPGKDYEGLPSSEAEVRFKLGERATWDADRARRQRKQNAKPLVLRVDEHDLQSLQCQPGYVTYGLRHCARKTVLAPTAVFRELNRGEGCREDLKQGWAFCGKPRRAYDNEGNSSAAPPNMVYLVYADREGFVFDWDWVQENPGEPGFPINRELRFGNPVVLEADAILELPSNLPLGQFDASKACYSRRGDCIFCYISNEVAYADRINSDLTVFRQLGSEENITGFKVKNVQRILREDKSIVLHDVPELLVSVDAILLATLKGHKDASVEVYTILIRTLFRNTNGPPTVRVPREGPVALHPAGV